METTDRTAHGPGGTPGRGARTADGGRVERSRTCPPRPDDAPTFRTAAARRLHRVGGSDQRATRRPRDGPFRMRARRRRGSAASSSTRRSASSRFRSSCAGGSRSSGPPTSSWVRSSACVSTSCPRSVTKELQNLLARLAGGPVREHSRASSRRTSGRPSKDLCRGGPGSRWARRRSPRATGPRQWTATR